MRSWTSHVYFLPTQSQELYLPQSISEASKIAMTIHVIWKCYSSIRVSQYIPLMCVWDRNTRKCCIFFLQGEECCILILLRHKYKHLMINSVYLDLGMMNQQTLHSFLKLALERKIIIIVSSMFVPLQYAQFCLSLKITLLSRFRYFHFYMQKQRSMESKSVAQDLMSDRPWTTDLHLNQRQDLNRLETLCSELPTFLCTYPVILIKMC